MDIVDAIVERLAFLENPDTLDDVGNFVQLSEDRCLRELSLDFYIVAVYRYLQPMGFLDHSAREHDAPSSGVLFFYACISFIVHLPQQGDILEYLGDYNAIYTLIDHYMDDPSLTRETKKEAVKQIFLLLEDPTRRHLQKLIDPALFFAAEAYERMISRFPRCKEPLMSLFYEQVRGLGVQSSSERTEEEYREASMRKGRFTFETLAAMADVNHPHLCEKLGKAGQLIDDMLDVFDDMKSGIHTIATFVYRRDGHMNNLLWELFQTIESIPERFSGFFWVYLACTVYMILRIPQCFHGRITQLTKDYQGLYERYCGELNMRITEDLQARLRHWGLLKKRE